MINRQKQFASLLNLIAQQEKNTEILRQILFNQAGFSPQLAYSFLVKIDNDTQQQLPEDQKVSQEMLALFLNKHNITYTNQELQYIFSYLDLDKDMSISYEDFLNFIQPKSIQKTENKKTNNPIELQNLSNNNYELEWALLRLIQNEIVYYQQIEECKKINGLLNIENNQILEWLDPQNTGVIVEENINEFVMNNQIFLTTKDKAAMIRRLQGNDSNENGIQIDQICQIVQPLDQVQQNLYKNKQLDVQQSQTKSYYTPRKLGKYANDVQATQKKNFSRDNSQQQINIIQNYSIMDDQSGTLKKQRSSRSMTSQQKQSFSSLLNKNVSLSAAKQKTKKVTLSTSDQINLIVSLSDYIKYENEVNNLRVFLIANHLNFNLHEAFDLFDNKRNNKVNLNQFQKSLQQLNIQCSLEKSQLFFLRIDQNHDGQINFQEFSRLFYPMDEYLRKDLQRRCPNNLQKINGCSFDYDTMSQFKNLLIKLIDCELKVEQIRQSLARRPTLKLHDAFDYISQNRPEVLTVNDLINLFNSLNKQYSQMEISRLIQNISNYNSTTTITKSQFVEELQPRLKYFNMKKI